MDFGGRAAFRDLPDGGKRLLELAIAASPNAVIITDAALPDGPVVYANPAAERITGYPVGEILGRNPRFLQGPYSDHEGVAELRRAIAEGREFYGVLRNRRKDGSDFFNEMYVGPVRDGDGAVTHFVGIQNDVTERRALEEELERRAFHDPLTDLPNRALFLDRLGHALARAERDGDEMAVLVLDLDGFKDVNDSLGHAAGDALLLEAAGRIGGCLRLGDTVARLGGDEFAVLAEGNAGPFAAELADRIARELGAPYFLQGREVFPAASIGISFAFPGKDSPQDVLERADTAMYAAKGEGKARRRFYAPAMTRGLRERLDLEAGLRGAAERGEIVAHYQPVVELRTGEVVGAEALARWEHPERGTIGPGGFVPLAEETGLIVPLGRSVLREACRAAKGWRSVSGAPLGVSVNVSARQLRDPGLVDDVEGALRDAGLDPQLLTLEITESLFVEDDGATGETLRRLKGFGVRLAIDDFGTGYSSLSYLGRLPVDFVKLDRVLVERLERDRAGFTIALSTVTLAHTLGLAVVAEGVETAREAARLRALKCDLAQGYLWWPPLGPRETSDLFG